MRYKNSLYFLFYRQRPKGEDYRVLSWCIVLQCFVLSFYLISGNSKIERTALMSDNGIILWKSCCNFQEIVIDWELLDLMQFLSSAASRQKASKFLNSSRKDFHTEKEPVNFVWSLRRCSNSNSRGDFERSCFDHWKHKCQKHHCVTARNEHRFSFRHSSLGSFSRRD